MIRFPAGYDSINRIKRYQDYYQASYGVMLLSAGQFSPASLFSSGEQGAWYDPSDFSTMFQNAAGTTPVTAVEQPVGLLLDKSKGLTLGAELVTNGNFSSNTWWSTGGGAAISGGALNFTAAVATSGAYRLGFATVGKYYELTFEIISISSGGIQITLGNSSGTNRTAAGVYTQRILCTGNGNLTLYSVGASTTASVDNVSIKEVQGNHASQSTFGSQPVLSARVNLLTYTEQFDNVAWVKYSVAVPATKYADPYGGTTANLLYPTAATTDASLYRGGFASVSKTHSYAVKAAGKSWFCILKEGTSGGAAWFNLSTGLVGTVAAGYTASNPVPLGNGWYRCSVTSTSGFSQYTAISAVDADNSTTPTPNGTDGIYIWGADLRPTNAGVGLPVYQRVAAATDYDTSGFPLYLKFDGVDDSLATATIDPGSVDKAQVFAGVRKLSDAAVGQLVELSDNVSSNAGSFSMPASDGGAFWTAAANGGNGGLNLAVVNAGSLAAPISTVNTSLIDFALATGDVTFRVNGTSRGSSTADTGSSNFSSYPLYIGRRNNSTLPFNGQVYSMILRFSATNMDAATISSTETWVNGKTGAY